MRSGWGAGGGEFTYQSNVPFLTSFIGSLSSFFLHVLGVRGSQLRVRNVNRNVSKKCEKIKHHTTLFGLGQGLPRIIKSYYPWGLLRLKHNSKFETDFQLQ